MNLLSTSDTEVPGEQRTRLSERHEFTRRAMILLALIAAAAIVCYTAKVFLLAFAGLLLAVFLEFLASRLAAHTRISRGWSFAIVSIGIALLLVAAAWYSAPHVADQISQLIYGLPQFLTRVRDYISQRPWGGPLLTYLPSALASANLTGSIASVLFGVAKTLAAVVVIAVVGLYIGANPVLYEHGLLRLFGEHSDLVRYVGQEVCYTLRWWVLGQLVPMGVLGFATWIGLRLMHIHLAFTLALFTGLMVFIPYIGSLIALVAAILVAAVQGAQQVLWVFLLYIGIHTAEGYLLTPLVQKRAVHVPPALTILSQVLMGLLLGFLGLALATPLTATLLVLVRILHLREAPAHH